VADAPKPVRLDLSLFPQEPWATALVNAFNQLSLQTTQALSGVGGVLKEISFKTGATVANSFPIDIPVASPVKSARVAMVLSGLPTGPVTVVAAMLSGGKHLRVSSITGLAANTPYALRLALE
jgi:hypothetical protein